jgi:thiol-disulfide isomerase/thioredoxin
MALAALALVLAGCPKNEATTSTPTPTPTPTATSTSTASASASATPTASASDGARVVVVPAEADALSAIRTENARAKKEGRVVLVYIGATWCPPCARLHAALRTDAAKAKLAGVTLLAFDADTDGERLNALGYTSRYIPFFAVPRPDGRASDDKMDTSFKKTASGEEVVDKLADFVAQERAKK